MSKISPQQLDLLKLMYQAKLAGRFWVPPSGSKQDYLKSEDRWILISGAGIALSIKALWRKGLANPIPGHEPNYWSEITEQGIECLKN